MVKGLNMEMFTILFTVLIVFSKMAMITALILIMYLILKANIESIW